VVALLLRSLLKIQCDDDDDDDEQWFPCEAIDQLLIMPIDRLRSGAIDLLLV